MQLVKPRARPDGFGGWLAYGLGVNMYSSVSLDRALTHWYRAAIRKIANASNPAPK